MSDAAAEVGRRAHRFLLTDAVPSYTYGFAAGRFSSVVQERVGHVDLQYVGTDTDEATTRRVFADTPDMLRFFESRAGVPYPWLNEGMATFMAAAYVEHRFGRDAYDRLIASYRSDYERIRDAARDHWRRRVLDGSACLHATIRWQVCQQRRPARAHAARLRPQPRGVLLAVVSLR
jgi:aminopeptidase N